MMCVWCYEEVSDEDTSACDERKGKPHMTEADYLDEAADRYYEVHREMEMERLG